MDSLLNLVSKAQNGNETAMLSIIIRFEPLIKKLSRELNYEEAQTDLIIFIIELTRKIPRDKFNNNDEGQLVNYIHKSLTNRKFYLFRKYVKGTPEKIPLDETRIGCESMIDKLDDKIFLEELLRKLSTLQKQILTLKYLYGYSNIEIANKLNISRQAVNQAKNRAMNKINFSSRYMRWYL